MCLTETQTAPGSSTAHIEKVLDDFVIEFNCSQNSKYQSLAFCHKPSIAIRDHFKISGFSLLKFTKDSFSHQQIIILLVYRQSSQSKAIFFNSLSNFLRENNVDIILGDFNIDYFDPMNDIIENLTENYEMIVDKPTHLSGGLIDHVYLRKSFIDYANVNCIVKNVYFSDHDAVCFNISY